jgi:hypothetical protein
MAARKYSIPPAICSGAITIPISIFFFLISGNGKLLFAVASIIKGDRIHPNFRDSTEPTEAFSSPTCDSIAAPMVANAPPMSDRRDHCRDVLKIKQ